ncbi:MAG: DUF4296 domain-containing protein [Bacteroidales bacterium]|nr:DUF4296 domain-containing protein [Bacteroidales bacterium]
MKTVFIISLTFLLFFSLASCTERVEDKIKPPDDLITREEMVDIIVDMHIFDAVMASEQKKGGKEVQNQKYYLYNSIMEKHNITRERFDESFKYYQHDFEVMDDIYADVITKLSIMKSEAERE